jgi:hypothetical protein
MVAIRVIVIVKWHWYFNAFNVNGLTTLILAFGVKLGICSCVTRMMQISGSTSLVPAVLCTFGHQLYGDCNVAAAFLPHQGQSLAQGLIVVMTLVTNVAFILWHFGCSQICGN